MKELYVKASPINGKGIYTHDNIIAGDFIAYIKGPKILIKKFTKQISKNTLNWIGTSKHTWINTDDSIFRFINHSCNPNCAIKGERTVYAIKNIKAGNELTIDYSLNEAEEDWLIESCSCGSNNCRKVITPIYKLSKKIFREKEKHINSKFRRLYNKYYHQYH